MTETTFRNLCKELFPQARIQRIKDKDKQNHHITLRDISREEVYSTLETMGLEVFPSSRTHSTAYTGNKVLYENSEVYFVVRDRNTNAKHYMRRKEVTPDAIGLGGQTFTDPNTLKQATLQGLLGCTTKENTQALMSILNKIDGSGEFELKEILSTDKSRITSDFGEVASAYARTLKGQTVEFPARSNFEGVDFFADGVGVSAKGDKGSSRLSVVDFKDAVATLDNSNASRVLTELSDRNIYDVLEIASEVCEQLTYWKDKVGNFSKESLIKYTEQNTYDNYLEDIKQCQDGEVLGIPKKEPQCRTCWLENDHNPLLFTLLTILDRYYSEQNLKEISDNVVKLFINTNIEFEYFDYNVDTETIDINILPISQYKIWKINYWGNAGNALNNWPAVKGVE